MRFKRKNRPEPPKWLVAAGIVLAGAAAAYAISRVLRSESLVRRRELAALQKRVIQALMDEEVSGSHSVEAAVVGLGVVELSGVVETPADARTLIHIIDNVPGVHAVLSRLEVREIEDQLQKNRERPRTGESARWYGATSGNGGALFDV